MYMDLLMSKNSNWVNKWVTLKLYLQFSLVMSQMKHFLHTTEHKLCCILVTCDEKRLRIFTATETMRFQPRQ